jgi:hypothetical protein
MNIVFRTRTGLSGTWFNNPNGWTGGSLSAYRTMDYSYTRKLRLELKTMSFQVFSLFVIPKFLVVTTELQKNIIHHCIHIVG